MRILNFRNIYINLIPANTLDLDVVILIRARNEADAGRFVIFVHSTCNNSSLLIICICNTDKDLILIVIPSLTLMWVAYCRRQK